MSSKPRLLRLTTDEFATAMLSDDWLVRNSAMARYSKQKPSPDAIHVLRRALTDSYHGTVKLAAKSLRKLGPAATEAMGDLIAAAANIDAVTKVPQAYPDCIEAMASIEPTHSQLLPLIKKHSVIYNNWVPISSSLRTLKIIGTDEAKAVLRDTAEFWQPELNKTQKRVIEQLLVNS